MYILTLNCGSSSVKYQLYDWDNRAVLAKGAVERVTVGGAFITHYSRGKGTTTFEHECPSHREAVDLIVKLLLDPEKGSIQDIQEIKVVGHRLVHGGEKFAKSVIVDTAAMRIFKGFSDLSPLHNPANILGIEAAQRLLPNVPHCVILDTAWHQTMPEHAYIYALPYKWYKNYGIRRYGFHGTSFLYVAKRASVLLGRDPFQTNLISLHIGNGASASMASHMAADLAKNAQLHTQVFSDLSLITAISKPSSGGALRRTTTGGEERMPLGRRGDSPTL